MKKWFIPILVSFIAVACLATYVAFVGWGVDYTQAHLAQLIIPCFIAFVFFTVPIKLFMKAIENAKKTKEDIRKCSYAT